MFGKRRDNQLLLNSLQSYCAYIGARLDRLEAKIDRLEKLIRVAAPHPLGEPK